MGTVILHRVEPCTRLSLFLCIFSFQLKEYGSRHFALWGADVSAH